MDRIQEHVVPYSKFTRKNGLNEGKRIPAWMKDEPELIKFAEAIPSARFEEDYDGGGAIRIILPLDEEFVIQFYYNLKSSDEYTPGVFGCGDENGEEILKETKSADRAIAFARKMLNNHPPYTRMYREVMTANQAIKALQKMSAKTEVELTVR